MNSIETVFVLLTATLAAASAQVRNVPSYELEALYDLYNSTNGDYWTWDPYYADGNIWEFGPNANPCLDDWKGITCINSTTDDAIAYVKYIVINNFNMTGTLPASIGNFSELEQLDLSSNSIHGSIPSDIGKLQMLFTFALSYNAFTGNLPITLYSLPNLQYIKLQYNYFAGSISPAVGNLTNLVGFRAEYNLLTGEIPAEFSNCTRLSGIILSNNKLRGHIPPELGSVPSNFAAFLVDNNQLSGPLPPELGGMCNLQFQAFMVNNNQLTGTIPNIFNNCTFIQYLYLDNNSFHGPLPPMEIKALEYLNLGGNKLTGTIPLSTTYVSGTRTMTLSSNLLNGTIPSVIFGSLRLNHISLDNNQFWGPLILPAVNYVTTFDVSNNSLTGTLPDELFQEYIQTIDLSYNLFQGTIPETIVDAYQVRSINFDHNLLESSIPTILMNLTLLNALFLADNQLTGTIPPFLQAGNYIAGAQHIEGFDVHANYLEGTIPPSMLSAQYLLEFNVGQNYLTGTIPAQNLANLNSVSGLSMYDNYLTGPVPSEVSKLPSLQLLFLDDNMLTGDLGSMFDGSVQLALKYVDVSNNQLRGSIPTSPFQVPTLESFAAVSNCLYGSLPTESICALQNLTTLAMDGMESSTACQYLFFPHVPSVYNAYGLYHKVSGGIDRCLFDMPNLATLHLSGNAITGTIPDDIVVSDAMKDLSLSHNLLSGTIPDNVQFHRWTNLDLSYNKLTGGLSHQFPELSGNSSLSLEVNRLSGVIPHSLKYAENIDMLDGNLWKCDTQRTQLPENDKHADIYECGSNTFNYALYIWIALCCLVVGFKTALWHYSRSQKDETLWSSQFFEDLSSWMSIFEQKEGKDYDDSSFLKFDEFSDSIRKACALITLFIVAILMPVYIALSFTENTYAYEYAWTVSAAYLSGLASTVVLMIGFAALALTALYTVLTYVRYDRSLVYPSPLKGYPAALLLSFLGVLLMNIAVVLAVNVGYVYVHVTYNSLIVHTCQFALAIFKLAWNNWAVRELLSLTKKFEANQETWLVASKSKYGRQRIGLEVLMILLNNLGAPFVATALVSSDCFYNIIAAPPKVDVSYTYKACIDNEFLNINGSYCAAYDNAEVVSTSYEPPFLYSYQCGSTFITTYATIYVFMFIITAFIAPIAFAGISYCHQKSSEGSRLKDLIGSMMPKILKLHVSLNQTVKKIDAPRNDTSTSSNDSAFKVFEYNVIFHCDLFVVKVINIFAMILTFGAVLPPLAVVGLVAVVSFSYYSQLLIGRFVVKAGAGEDRSRVIESMNRDCEHAADMFMNAVWIVVPFTAVFYAILLLDTLGDAEGWHKALWAPIVTVSTPICVWAMWQLLKCSRKKSGVKEKKDSFFADQEPQHALTENPLGVNVGIVGKL